VVTIPKKREKAQKLATLFLGKKKNFTRKLKQCSLLMIFHPQKMIDS
jgi:hypothetical protein